MTSSIVCEKNRSLLLEYTGYREDLKKAYSTSCESERDYDIYCEINFLCEVTYSGDDAKKEYVSLGSIEQQLRLNSIEHAGLQNITLQRHKEQIISVIGGLYLLFFIFFHKCLIFHNLENV